MKFFYIILSVYMVAVGLIAGCGKKEEVQPVAKPEVLCWPVTILSITGDQTLMEKNTPEKYRLIRNGNYGKEGDVFTFCEAS